MTTHPNETQVGGSHYKKATFQSWDWQLYGLGGWEQAIVKYITRYQDKNGLQDLEKAQHYLDKTLFHFRSGEVKNTCRASLSAVHRYLEENQCDCMQRAAIEFIVMWRTEEDLLACKKHVQELIDELKAHLEENAAQYNELEEAFQNSRL